MFCSFHGKSFLKFEFRIFQHCLLEFEFHEDYPLDGSKTGTGTTVLFDKCFHRKSGEYPAVFNGASGSVLEVPNRL